MSGDENEMRYRVAFRRNVRFSEPYQNISIFTGYTDIFCKGANKLPVRTGNLSLPEILGRTRHPGSSVS